MGRDLDVLQQTDLKEVFQNLVVVDSSASLYLQDDADLFVVRIRTE
jgi:hypothetical protein